MILCSGFSGHRYQAAAPTKHGHCRSPGRGGESILLRALNNSLNKKLPTMPNEPNACRLLPTYPIDSA